MTDTSQLARTSGENCIFSPCALGVYRKGTKCRLGSGPWGRAPSKLPGGGSRRVNTGFSGNKGLKGMESMQFSLGMFILTEARCLGQGVRQRVWRQLVLDALSAKLNSLGFPLLGTTGGQEYSQQKETCLCVCLYVDIYAHTFIDIYVYV